MEAVAVKPGVTEEPTKPVVIADAGYWEKQECGCLYPGRVPRATRARSYSKHVVELFTRKKETNKRRRVRAAAEAPLGESLFRHPNRPRSADDHGIDDGDTRLLASASASREAASFWKRARLLVAGGHRAFVRAPPASRGEGDSSTPRRRPRRPCVLRAARPSTSRDASTTKPWSASAPGERAMRDATVSAAAPGTLAGSAPVFCGAAVATTSKAPPRPGTRGAPVTFAPAAWGRARAGGRLPRTRKRRRGRRREACDDVRPPGPPQGVRRGGHSGTGFFVSFSKTRLHDAGTLMTQSRRHPGVQAARAPAAASSRSPPATGTSMGAVWGRPPETPSMQDAVMLSASTAPRGRRRSTRTCGRDADHTAAAAFGRGGDGESSGRRRGRTR